MPKPTHCMAGGGAGPKDTGLDLIARLEAATEDDRRLDIAIARALGLTSREDGWIETSNPMEPDYPGLMPCPFFTCSVDDAMTLAPKGVWLNVETGTQKSAPSWEWPVVEIGDQETGETIWKGQAKTLPRTLCIAFLKARSA